jgi:hypothetical protein
MIISIMTLNITAFGIILLSTMTLTFTDIASIKLSILTLIKTMTSLSLRHKFQLIFFPFIC